MASNSTRHGSRSARTPVCQGSRCGLHRPPVDLGATCHRARAASSSIRASTQRSPSGVSSSFQKGASVLSQSIRKPQASSAALTMRRGGGDQDDRPRPAASGRHDGRARLSCSGQRRRASASTRRAALRHARIVLERHGGDGLPAMLVRTNPTKLATAPMSVRSRAKPPAPRRRPRARPGHAPFQPPGHRRKERHLVAGAQRIRPPARNPC